MKKQFHGGWFGMDNLNTCKSKETDCNHQSSRLNDDGIFASDLRIKAPCFRHFPILGK